MGQEGGKQRVTNKKMRQEGGKQRVTNKKMRQEGGKVSKGLLIRRWGRRKGR